LFFRADAICSLAWATCCDKAENPPLVVVVEGLAVEVLDAMPFGTIVTVVSVASVVAYLT